MKNFRKIIFVALVFFTPFIMRAADEVKKATGGLVTCGNAGQPDCNFEELMHTINVVIDFLLFKLSIPIAAIMFAYAGFLYLTSGGSEEKVGAAKKIFGHVFLGLVIALAAFLIIKAILTSLGYSGPWFLKG